MKLGKEIIYPEVYDPTILDGISRSISRKKIDYDPSLFTGFDLWIIYEFSHINEYNIPNNSILTIIVNQTSNNIVESKSLKLYFNSLNNLKENFNDCLLRIASDIKEVVGGPVQLNSHKNREFNFKFIENDTFILLENVVQQLNNSYFTLKNDDRKTYRFYTNLFRSNCPVTHQPDWASIYISIETQYKVEPDQLLAYLLSFRNHNAFHESCIEEMIVHLRKTFLSESISILGKFTRRGGIDINPFRSFGKIDKKMQRLIDASVKLRFNDIRQ